MTLCVARVMPMSSLACVPNGERGPSNICGGSACRYRTRGVSARIAQGDVTRLHVQCGGLQDTERRDRRVCERLPRDSRVFRYRTMCRKVGSNQCVVLSGTYIPGRGSSSWNVGRTQQGQAYFGQSSVSQPWNDVETHAPRNTINNNMNRNKFCNSANDAHRHLLSEENFRGIASRNRFVQGHWRLKVC